MGGREGGWEDSGGGVGGENSVEVCAGVWGGGADCELIERSYFHAGCYWDQQDSYNHPLKCSHSQLHSSRAPKQCHCDQGQH